MKSIYFPPVAILAGAILLIASIVWPRAAGPGVVWSDEQADEYAQASADLHAAAHAGGHAKGPGHAHAHGAAGEDSAGADQKLAAAQQRFQQQEAALARAHAMRWGPARWFWWSGLILTAGGVAAFYWARAAGR
ncbi:MAG: hypothetical protein HQ581_13405 [Planctomycetes bacterium]|nr:hypothetical protein [Planctomycetota bacterium]